MTNVKSCSVCEGNVFTSHKVLWKELIETWGLAAHEVEYIDKQQGFCCNKCGNNLRSMALADALIKHYNYCGTLIDFVKSETAKNIKVLEINEAGGLTPILSQLPNYLYVEYPEFDMMKLPFESGSFDLVVHSDTLEHVPDPNAGLSECRRILRNEGACIFTIPIIMERLDRSRDGLIKSYHGSPETDEGALVVHTEFGADFWQKIIMSGFSDCAIHSFDYPAGLAIKATF